MARQHRTKEALGAHPFLDYRVGLTFSERIYRLELDPEMIALVKLRRVVHKLNIPDVYLNAPRPVSRLTERSVR